MYTNTMCFYEYCKFSFALITMSYFIQYLYCYQAKPEDTLDLCRILNDDMASIVRKHPTRFVGLGTLPMQAPALAAQELKRCKEELGK